MGKGLGEDPTNGGRKAYDLSWLAVRCPTACVRQFVTVEVRTKLDARKVLN